MANRCVEHLLQDHRQCEQILAEFEPLLDALQARPEWTTAQDAIFNRITSFFEAAQASHLRKEDEILYPALEAFLPRDVGPLAVLRAEHADLGANLSRLSEVGEALSAGASSRRLFEDFERCGRATIRILRDHIYKEDRVLFPMVARFLTPEQDARLFQQMQAISRRDGPPAGSLGCQEPPWVQEDRR